MPVFRLDDRLVFPPVALAEDGVLAVGGDLSPERLLLAYRSGIFPWYHDGIPIFWHSPDPRMVLEAGDLHVPKRLERTMRRRPFRVTLDTAFGRVIEACARQERPGQEGTWITPQMLEAYTELHRLGWAHSAEAWQGDELAGGLYGVSLGGAFFGESMFALVPDASKIAFVELVRELSRRGIRLIDCQVYTEHLARFGARQWPRGRYLAALARSLRKPPWRGTWSFEH
jgi:leucyl/phenylalanyl-tRNA--protein transferase